MAFRYRLYRPEKKCQAAAQASSTALDTLECKLSFSPDEAQKSSTSDDTPDLLFLMKALHVLNEEELV
jgi:hypothetical protein